MRLGHWEAFAPLCPRCLHFERTEQLLVLEPKVVAGDFVVEASATCPAPTCGQVYPIFDGIPILVPDVAAYVAAWAQPLLERQDLPPNMASMLDNALPVEDTYHLMRQYLSTYAWDGYSEFESHSDGVPVCTDSCASSSVVAALEGLDAVTGLGVDLGCGVGRSTFELAARSESLVLGIEQNFPFAKLAQRVLRDGGAAYPLRRHGVVYEEHEFKVSFAHSERVDFWICDAQALPFADSSIGAAVGLNLLDSVADPLALLGSLLRVLSSGAFASLATPFEWREAVTPRHQWIGGRSAYVSNSGEPVAALKQLIDSEDFSALKIELERDGLLWRTRVDDRATTEYQNYLVRLRKRGA